MLGTAHPVAMDANESRHENAACGIRYCRAPRKRVATLPASNRTHASDTVSAPVMRRAERMTVVELIN